MKILNILFFTIIGAAYSCEFLSKNLNEISIKPPLNKTFCFNQDIIANTDQEKNQQHFKALIIEDKLFEFIKSEANTQSSDSNLT